MDNNQMNLIPSKQDFQNPVSNYNIQKLAEKLLYTSKKELPISNVFFGDIETQEKQFELLKEALKEKNWNIVKEKNIDESKIAKTRSESNVGYDPQEDFGNITEHKHHQEIERRRKLHKEELAEEFNLYKEVVRIY